MQPIQWFLEFLREGANKSFARKIGFVGILQGAVRIVAVALELARIGGDRSNRPVDLDCQPCEFVVTRHVQRLSRSCARSMRASRRRCAG